LGEARGHERSEAYPDEVACSNASPEPKAADALRAEEQIERILAEAEHVLGRYVTSEGTVMFDAPAHIVTAREP
jgi:hypothetical protein